LIETVGPESLVTVEPFVGLMHRLGAQPARHRAAVLGADDEPGLGENVEMLHHRRQGHGEGLGKLADGQAIAPAEARQERPPGGVGQRGKSAVEWLGPIVNHLVKYTVRADRVKLLVGVGAVPAGAIRLV
jgi:hypothetical protein